MRAPENKPRGRFAAETYIRFGFGGARSYCRDFIKEAPLCVASKGSIVSDLGVTFAVTWWTWKSHFSLFPDRNKTCKIRRVDESKQHGAITVEMRYTANNNPLEHLWQVDQVALVDPVHLEAQEDP